MKRPTLENGKQKNADLRDQLDLALLIILKVATICGVTLFAVWGLTSAWSLFFGG